MVNYIVMKKIVFCLIICIGTSNAQLQYTIEDRPYNDGDAYVGWVKNIPNEDKMIWGNSYIDKDGNIIDAIPSIPDGTFNYTSSGCYITYRPSKTSYDTRTVFVSNDKLSTLSNLAGEPEVVIEKLKPSQKIGKESSCYKNFNNSLFYQAGSNYDVVYVDPYFVRILEGSEVIRSVEVYNPGKKLKYGFSRENYYALYASENSLSLVKVNLENGTQEVRVLKDKHQNYSGGTFEIVGDKIYVVSFYGDCSYNFMANTQLTKGDGIVCFTVNASDLAIESEFETALPDSYQNLFRLSNNKVTDPKVISIYKSDKDVFIATGNGTGMGGSQTTVVAPMLIWKMEDEELKLLGALGGIKSTYPTSATFFSYDDKDYLLYCCTYTYDSYKENINLIDITDGIGESSIVHTLDLNKENIDFYFNGATSLYLTPGGKLMFVGKGKNYQSVLYLKIDIPS